MTFADFIARWKDSSGAERANKDAFLLDLCDAPAVERPSPTTGDPERDLYVFEKDVEQVLASLEALGHLISISEQPRQWRAAR